MIRTLPVIALSALPSLALAGNECEKKLVQIGAAAGDAFGFGVAVEGDVLIVGARQDDVGGNVDEGSVSIFRRVGFEWVFETPLVASAGATGDLFGTDVAIDGDVIVVGACLDNIGSNIDQGSATVFRWNGASWVEEQTLVQAAGQPDDLFGWDVDISGDVIVVSAPQRDVGGVDQGTLTVFRWNGASWVEEAELISSVGGPFDDLGASAGISGNVIVAGAKYSDMVDTDAGLVTVFRWDGANWNEEQHLFAATTSADDWFGYGVDVDGDAIVAGSPFDLGDGGTVTVFRWDGASWNEEQSLTTLTQTPGDFLGNWMAIQGDRIVADFWGHASGLVFDFDGATWTQTAELSASDGEPMYQRVAFDDDTIVLPTPVDDDGFALVGSVYVYDLNECVASAEIPRAGSPPNPSAFLEGVTGGPVIGSIWDPVIDHTSFVPGALADFVLVTGGPFNLPIGLEGTLLCDPTTPLFEFVTADVGEPFLLPVPELDALVGLTICAQGGSVSAGLTSHLTNALDATIGTY